jgi:hypothetical protein
MVFLRQFSNRYSTWFEIRLAIEPARILLASANLLGSPPEKPAESLEISRFAAWASTRETCTALQMPPCGGGCRAR